MNSYERAFLDSIHAVPEDDAARLIFADWLEENGQPERGEFIRVQCELGTYGEYRCKKYLGGLPDAFYGLPVMVDGKSSCRCRWCGLKSREKELEFRTAFWGADFPFPAMPKNGYCEWHRGFVEKIRLSSDDWLRHADELVRLTPLREVELTTVPTVIRKTGKLRRAEWPHTMRGWGFLGRDGSVPILGSSDARRRVELCLRAEWPNIKFTLPPPAPFSTTATVSPRMDMTVLDVPGADRDIQVGDMIGPDAHDRVIRAFSRETAVGVALSRMDANGMVRVRLVDDSTMQLHQNAAGAQRLRRAMEDTAKEGYDPNGDYEAHDIPERDDQDR